MRTRSGRARTVVTAMAIAVALAGCSQAGTESSAKPGAMTPRNVTLRNAATSICASNEKGVRASATLPTKGSSLVADRDSTSVLLATQKLDKSEYLQLRTLLDRDQADGALRGTVDRLRPALDQWTASNQSLTAVIEEMTESLEGPDISASRTRFLTLKKTAAKLVDGEAKEVDSPLRALSGAC
jgi:hypothetical protein